MTFDEYRVLAQRTSNVAMTSRSSLQMAALGVTGEAGEIADLVKKHVYHDHPLEREKLIEEAGDLMWYLAEICTTLGVSMDEVAQRNIEKLRARYPDGFDPERSKDRLTSKA